MYQWLGFWWLDDDDDEDMPFVIGKVVNRPFNLVFNLPRLIERFLTVNRSISKLGERC